MSAHLSAGVLPVSNPALGHRWHSEDDGTPCASVDLSKDRRGYITFTAPASARELAAACIAAAEWLEANPASPEPSMAGEVRAEAARAALPSLKASDSGYGAFGVARLDVAS